MSALYRTVPVADIAVGKRLRPVNRDVAAAYAESYRAGAAVPPILIRPIPDIPGFPHELVAGGHRLAGAILAGVEALTCEVRGMTDDEAQLAEAEENLVRRELSFLDRAVSLSAHKTAYERLHPQTANGKWSREAKFKKKQDDLRWQSLPPSERPPEETSFKTFSEASAEALGLSPRTIRDAITLLSRIDREAVELLQPHPVADSRLEIELLASLDQADQLHIARLIASGRARSVRDARLFGAFETKPSVTATAAEKGLSTFQQWIAAAPVKHGDLLAAYCARPIAEALTRAGWTVIPPKEGQ